jgi:hypothetical protein
MWMNTVVSDFNLMMVHDLRIFDKYGTLNQLHRKLCPILIQRLGAPGAAPAPPGNRKEHLQLPDRLTIQLGNNWFSDLFFLLLLVFEFFLISQLIGVKPLHKHIALVQDSGLAGIVKLVLEFFIFDIKLHV